MLLVVPILLALGLSWYSTRWYMGNFVAEFAPNMDEGQLEAALAAMRLAPDDPWTHWVVAGLKRKSFVPGDLQEAVHQYEEAVRLSPNDFRFWLDLGRAREAVGDRDGGERALRHAVELAPSYAYPHWYLGNLLLRSGNSEEAFGELRRAAEGDDKLRPQLYNVAWTLYGQDIGQIRKAVGDSPADRSGLIGYLLGRQQLDEAMHLWSTLGPEDKRKSADVGRLLATQMFQLKRYHTAANLLKESGPEGNAATSMQFINGSFEDDIDNSAANFLDWHVKSEADAQVAIDGNVGHSGERSLRILFRSSAALAFDHISQLIMVESSKQYRFECYVRAEDLKSAGTPAIIILDASDGKTVLGGSQPIAPGTYDWQPIAIDFKTSPNTEAVTVLVVRAMCGGDAVCPIFGKVWYDDFNLQGSGGTAEPRDSRDSGKARG